MDPKKYLPYQHERVYSDEQKSFFQPYLSDPDADIFVLKNLGGVVGAAFARYSRQKGGVKDTLLELVKDEKIDPVKSTELIERILIQYGDDSVGELEGAHLALENISNLATKEIEDRVLAPIGVRFLAVEKLVMGTLHSILSGLLVLPLAKIMLHGGITLNLHQWALTLSLAVLIGLVSSSLGLTLGTYIKPEKIGLMFSLIIAPLIFFGCTYYPWEKLNQIPWMQRLVLINPLVYMAEGLRAAITPHVPHMHLLYILAGLFTSLILFTWLGLGGFYRRVID